MIKKEYSILPPSSTLIDTLFTSAIDPVKRVYSFYLEDLKDCDLNVMEVGCRGGENLVSFSKLFSNSKIFGLDKNLDFTKTYNKMFEKHEEFQNIRVMFNDSTINYSWVLIDEKFDIIIDNGSSKPDNQVKTLRRAWGYLVPGGTYIVQNSSSSYKDPSIDVLAAEIFLIERSRQAECVSYYYKNNGLVDFITVIKKNKLRK